MKKMMILSCLILIGTTGWCETETIEIKKKVDCYYCKGTGLTKKKQKQTCDACKGQGYMIHDNGTRTYYGGNARGIVTRKNSATKVNCRRCGSKGFTWIYVDEQCSRCNGRGFEMQKSIKEVTKKLTAEERDKRHSARQEAQIKRKIAAYSSTNNLNVVLYYSSQGTLPAVNSCYGCSEASNRVDNAVYMLKVIELLPDNMMVTDLVKNNGLYDDKLNKQILVQTLSEGYAVKDYLKNDTFYKYVGEKEFRDRFNRKKSAPCFKEISKAEYDAFVEETVRSQFDNW